MEEEGRGAGSGASSGRMEGRGEGKRTQETRSRANTLWTECFGKKLSEWTANDLCQRSCYEAFAMHLATSVKRDGKSPFNPSTGEIYFNAAVQAAYFESRKRACEEETARGGRSTAVVDKVETFFRCLIPGSRSLEAAWLKGLRNNLRRRLIAAVSESGGQLDNSATALGRRAIEAVLSSYATSRTTFKVYHPSQRRFALLVSWLAAGRTTEGCYMSYEEMQWDREHEAVALPILQLKTGKVKHIVLVASPSADFCFFQGLGELLASRPLADAAATAWVLPELASHARPGKAMGDFLRDAPVEHGALPPNVSAAGIRHGAAQFLYERMPIDMAVATTGHDLAGFTALWDYLHVTPANAMTGAAALAGWPAVRYGERTRGPRPPRIEPLLQRECASEGELNRLIDSVFYFDQGGKPEALLEGGELRKAVEAAFAALVMRYQQRAAAQGFPQVQSRLLKTVGSRRTLEEWSGIVARDFRTRNMHMWTSPGLTSPGPSPVNAAWEDFHTELGEVRNQIAGMSAKLDALGEKFDVLLAAKREGGEKFAGEASKGKRQRTEAPLEAEPQLEAKPSPVVELLPGLSRAPPAAFDAVEAYVMFKTGVSTPRVDAGRKQLSNTIRLSNKWFDAMASEEEKVEIASATTDPPRRREIALNISEHLRKFFFKAFAQLQLEPGHSLAPTTSGRGGKRSRGKGKTTQPFPLSKVENTVSALKKAAGMSVLEPSAERMAAYRARPEDPVHIGPKKERGNLLSMLSMLSTPTKDRHEHA